MSPNPQHYVSLKIAKQLVEAGIEFGESEKVWVELAQKPIAIKNSTPIKFHKHTIRDRVDLKEVRDYKIIKLQQIGPSGLCFHPIIPAPSLMEILDRLPDKLKINVIAEQQRTYYFYLQKEFNGWSCFYAMNNGQTRLWTKGANTASHAAALMLIKVTEGSGD